MHSTSASGGCNRVSICSWRRSNIASSAGDRRIDLGLGPSWWKRRLANGERQVGSAVVIPSGVRQLPHGLGSGSTHWPSRPLRRLPERATDRVAARNRTAIAPGSAMTRNVRVLVVRGQHASPWELETWRDLPGRFEVKYLLTRQNRFSLDGTDLEAIDVRTVSELLPGKATQTPRVNLRRRPLSGCLGSPGLGGHRPCGRTQLLVLGGNGTTKGAASLQTGAISLGDVAWARDLQDSAGTDLQALDACRHGSLSGRDRSGA